MAHRKKPAWKANVSLWQTFDIYGCLCLWFHKQVCDSLINSHHMDVYFTLGETFLCLSIKDVFCLFSFFLIFLHHIVQPIFLAGVWSLYWMCSQSLKRLEHSLWKLCTIAPNFQIRTFYFQIRSTILYIVQSKLNKGKGIPCESYIL